MVFEVNGPLPKYGSSLTLHMLTGPLAFQVNTYYVIETLLEESKLDPLSSSGH